MEILLVEHPEVLAGILRRYLQSKGHRVDLQFDLSSARRALAARPYDFLISDVRLPDGDGTALLAGDQVGLPRFAVTMSAEDTVPGVAVSKPTVSWRHLPKPFAAEELDAELKAAETALSGEHGLPASRI